MPALLSDVKRLSSIARVLAQSGLGSIALSIGLHKYVPFWQRIFGVAAPDPRSAPANVRSALEQLGGSYIKLGQLLSVRPDLVPPEYADEFKTLQDNVPPFDASHARAIITSELGKSFDSIFKSFDNVPVGSASIAQVHRAVLRSGEHVVVKVQRPGVDAIFGEDIDIMKGIASELDRHKWLSDYQPSMIVEEFDRYTKRELDFRNEARAINRFGRIFKTHRDVVVPVVSFSTRKVLVMTEVHGTRLSEMGSKTFNRAKIVRILVDSMIDQIFVHSTFHADLHPGNILILPGDKVGLLDFGITGTLTPDLRKRGIEMYSAIVNNDSDAAYAALCRASLTPPKDTEALRREITELFSEWQDDNHKLPTSTFHRLFLVARKHNIRLPPDLILVGKALVTLEATCNTLEPHFNLVDQALERFQHIRDAELHRAFSLTSVKKAAMKARTSLSTFSEDALAVMDRLKRGVVHIDIEDTDIKHLGQDINTSSNRLAYALVISALLIFSALLINMTPKIGPLSVYSAIGIGLALLALIVLFVSIRREGKAGFDDHTKL